jgi:hypothetical protein
VIYTVEWSEEDQEYVATAAGFPSLSWLAPGPVQALSGLVRLIREYKRDLAAAEQATVRLKQIEG